MEVVEAVEDKVVAEPSTGGEGTNGEQSSNVEASDTEKTTTETSSNGEQAASTTTTPTPAEASLRGFEMLDAEVQTIFREGMAKHNLQTSDVDPAVFFSLSEFSLPSQREIASRYVGENLGSVNNKSGYLIGIMKKFRDKRGAERRSLETFSGANDEKGAPIPKLPPPKNSAPAEPNPDGGIKLLDPELKASLETALAKFAIESTAIDPCIFESFVTFPLSMQKDMVRMLTQENLSKIHNISGYIVGMLVKFRKRFLSNQQGGRRSRSRSPRRFSRGRSPPRRHSRGRSPPISFHSRRSPHRDRGRSPYSSRHGSPYRDRYSSSRRSPPRYDRPYYRRSPSPRYRSPPRHSSYSSSYSSRRSPPRRSPPRRSPPPARYEERSTHPPPSDSRAYPPDVRPYREIPPATPAIAVEVIPVALRHNWFFADRNQGIKNGPFPAEDIKREWNRGVMSSSWLAWHSGMPTWQEIRELPSLFYFLTGTPDMSAGIKR